MAQPPHVDLAIVSQPNNLEVIPDLLANINASIANSDLHDADFDRKSLLIKCRSLVQALETPRETLVKHTAAQPSAIAALSFGVDTGLWVLMAKNGEGPQKVDELASVLGVDRLLLSRLMRHVGAMGYLTEVGEDEYLPTNYSKAMSLPEIGNGYFAMLSGLSSGMINFHEYSRVRGWKNPTDASDTSLMHAYGTDKDVFSWLHHRGYDKHFSDLMLGQRMGVESWMSPNLYPVRARLIEGASSEPDAPFLVDMGGNLGGNIAKFRQLYPDAPGKLILQDMPTVISRIVDLDPSIDRMEHDLKNEQRVKGARAYHLHFILHDWPDDVCEVMLARIVEAMKPGYSRLLINEIVMPTSGAYWEATGLDIVMMTQLCAYERTLKDWRHLLEDKAGLKIVKVWSSPKAIESVIECELA